MYVSTPPSYVDKTIPGLGGGWSVNNQGHVAGFDLSGAPAFYNGSSVVKTSVYTGGQEEGSHILNDQDDIVGNIASGSTLTWPAMWHAGVITQLPGLPSALSNDAVPSAINDSQVIVGRSKTQGAIIWQGGNIRTLDSMLPKGSPWQLSNALDISNSGYILGAGTLAGAGHWFLTQIGVTLSGTLWVTDCTDQSCSRVGAVGEAVRVSGTAGNGNKVSASATSRAKGQWSVNVPTGTYGVTPAEGFVPDSKTVVANGSVAGIDFATCGAVGTSSARSNVETRATHARTDAASGETGCPDGIDWEMQDRAALVPDIAEKTDLGMLRQKDIYAPLPVSLYLSVDGSRVTHCAARSVWKWAVTSKPHGAHVLTSPISPGCDSQMIVDKQGPYKIVAKRYAKGKLGQTVTETVQVHDLLIIGMGDSNGGEG